MLMNAFLSFSEKIKRVYEICKTVYGLSIYVFACIFLKLGGGIWFNVFAKYLVVAEWFQTASVVSCRC